MKNLRMVCFVLCFLFAFVFVVGCSPNSSPSESASEPSVDGDSSVPSESATSDAVSDSGEELLFVSYSLDLSALMDTGAEIASAEIDDSGLKAFISSYSGAYPAVADLVCTEEECYVCVIYEAECTSEDVCTGRFAWYSTGEEDMWEIVSETPVPWTYDKNTCNKNGYFRIDYESSVSGTACPYVLLYCENGQERTLLFEEEATAYVRIIRQNDNYAVLSVLEDGDRHYVLVDKEGLVISELDWVSDISEVSPLMFDDRVLYCKTDSDEDFVYDTIGAIDLSNGEYSDILYVGNYDYWTYSADGSGIALYGDEFQSTNNVYYYSTADGVMHSFSLAQSVTKLEIANGFLYGVAEDGAASRVFVWNIQEQSLFETGDFSEDSRIVFGGEIFAVLDGDMLTVFGRGD